MKLLISSLRLAAASSFLLGLAACDGTPPGPTRDAGRDSGTMEASIPSDASIDVTPIAITCRPRGVIGRVEQGARVPSGAISAMTRGENAEIFYATATGAVMRVTVDNAGVAGIASEISGAPTETFPINGANDPIPDAGLVDTGTVVDTGVSLDAGADPDSEIDAGSDPDAEPDAGPDADADSDSGADPDAGVDPDAATDPDAVTNADSETDPDGATDPDSATNPDSATDPDSGNDSDAATDAGVDASTLPPPLAAPTFRTTTGASPNFVIYSRGTDQIARVLAANGTLGAAATVTRNGMPVSFFDVNNVIGTGFVFGVRSNARGPLFVARGDAMGIPDASEALVAPAPANARLGSAWVPSLVWTERDSSGDDVVLHSIDVSMAGIRIGPRIVVATDRAIVGGPITLGTRDGQLVVWVESDATEQRVHARLAPYSGMLAAERVVVRGLIDPGSISLTSSMSASGFPAVLLGYVGRVTGLDAFAQVHVSLISTSGAFGGDVSITMAPTGAQHRTSIDANDQRGAVVAWSETDESGSAFYFQLLDCM